MFQGSWKTTVAGALAFLTLNATEIYDWLSAHQDLDWRRMAFGFFVLLMGIFARDKNKSSQDDGLPPKIVSVDPAGNISNVTESKDERPPEVIVAPEGSDVVVQKDGTKILRLPE